MGQGSGVPPPRGQTIAAALTPRTPDEESGTASSGEACLHPYRQRSWPPRVGQTSAEPVKTTTSIRTSGKSHLTVNSYSALPVHPREPRKGILKADQPLPALKTPTDGSLHMDAWISHQTWPGPCTTFCYRTPAIKPPVPPSGVSKLWPSGQIWPIACFC